MKVLAVAAFVVALVAVAAHAGEIQSGDTTLVFDDQPSFEFWNTDAGRPKKGTDRAYQVWKWLKVCEPNTDCVTYNFNAMKWSSAQDSNNDVGTKIRFTPATLPAGFNTFAIELLLRDDCAGFPENSDSCVHLGFEFDHGALPVGTTMQVSLRKSHNNAVGFAATSKLSSTPSVPLVDESQGNTITLSWAISAKTDRAGNPIPNSHTLSQLKVPSSDSTGFYVVGKNPGSGAAVGAAVGGVVILGALGFWAYSKKKAANNEEDWETVEMELP